MKNLPIPKKINIGCGYHKLPDHLNIDVEPATEPDFLVVNNDLSPLPQRYFHRILANDVLEHICRDQAMKALLDWSSLLCDGGILDIQTSSIFGVVDWMRKSPGFTTEFNWTSCLFGNQKHPGDFHYNGFTEHTLRVHLTAAGFNVGEIGLRDNWLLWTSATKVFTWDNLLEKETNDHEFLASAYLQAFDREIDDVGRIVYFGELSKGRPRREVLRDIMSAPERLFGVAKQLGIA